jgi:hypothetical protein
MTGPAKIRDSYGPYGGFFYPPSSGMAPDVVPSGLELTVMSAGFPVAWLRVPG